MTRNEKRTVLFILVIGAASLIPVIRVPAADPPPKAEAVPAARFRGHSGPVVVLAFRADGSQVLSTSEKEVCLWDPATGKEIRKLTVDAESVVSFNADFTRLAIASSFHVDVSNPNRGMLVLRDIAQGKDLWKIDPHGSWDESFPFRPAVAAMAFSPDGKWLATVGSTTKVGGRHGLPAGIVKVWDAQTGKELKQFALLSTRASAVAFSADGKYLAVGTDGASGELPEPGEIHLWNTTNFERILQFRTRPEVDQGGDPGSITSIAFRPQSTLLASAVSDGTIRLWEIASGRELLELRGHQGQSASAEVDRFTGRILGRSRAVRAVAFSPDGNQLASGGFDRVVRIWNSKTGDQVASIRFDSAAINAVAFSPDGKRIAAGGSDANQSGDVMIWPLNSTPEKPIGQVVPTVNKAALAETESKLRGQIELAIKTDEPQWQDFDAAKRSVKDRLARVQTKSLTLGDAQVARAVYLLTVGRVPTNEEVQRAEREFSESKNRALNVVQLARTLVQTKEYDGRIAAVGERLLHAQHTLALKRANNEIPILWTAEEFQDFTTKCANAVHPALKSDEQLVELGFLLTVSRFPTATESTQWTQHLKKSPDRAATARELFLNMMNTAEFIYSK